MKFVVSHGKPSVAEYNELRRLNELPSLEEKLVTAGLYNTLFCAVVHDESGLIVGMGRVVGDGAIYMHIQDVIVRPAHHGMGIGKAIMHEILKYLETAGGEHTNIGLMCSKDERDSTKNSASSPDQTRGSARA